MLSPYTIWCTNFVFCAFAKSFDAHQKLSPCALRDFLKSYLDFVEKDKEELLSDKINNQLIDAEKSINELDNNLSGQIESDLIKVLKTYDEIQTAVVLLKVDMLQALNIAVDYADADGD